MTSSRANGKTPYACLSFPASTRAVPRLSLSFFFAQNVPLEHPIDLHFHWFSRDGGDVIFQLIAVA